MEKPSYYTIPWTGTPSLRPCNPMGIKHTYLEALASCDRQSSASPELRQRGSPVTRVLAEPGVTCTQGFGRKGISAWMSSRPWDRFSIQVGRGRTAVTRPAMPASSRKRRAKVSKWLGGQRRMAEISMIFLALTVSVFLFTEVVVAIVVVLWLHLSPPHWTAQLR